MENPTNGAKATTLHTKHPLRQKTKAMEMGETGKAGDQEKYGERG